MVGDVQSSISLLSMRKSRIVKHKNEIKMKINNEKELLNLFMDEDALRPQMREPFINSNYEGEVWATDGLDNALSEGRYCSSRKDHERRQ